MSVSPPRAKLPPLNALRAFEAAARLGGFKQAAGELNVTPGAVAQHIKFLEAWCGAELFERRAQGVRLSTLGRSVLPEFVTAFDAISAASQLLRKQAAPRSVSIAALPSIAQLLLTDWLPKLRLVLPDVQVSVTAMETMPNLAREAFDLTLFFETEVSGNGMVLSGPDALLPVCAPNIAAGLDSFEALAAMPHISDQFWPSDWPLWWEKTTGADYTGAGPSYSLFSMAVAETLAEAGVLMGHLSLVAPLLQRGELVAPFEAQVSIEQFLVMGLNPNSDGKVLTQITNFLRELAAS